MTNKIIKKLSGIRDYGPTTFYEGVVLVGIFLVICVFLGGVLALLFLYPLWALAGLSALFIYSFWKVMHNED